MQILDQTGFGAMIAKLKRASASGTAPAHPSAAAPTAGPLTVPPSQIFVTVENGVGINGLAGKVTTALAQDGFRTGVPGPANSTTYTKSEIHYSPGEKSAALTLAAAVPGSILKADPSVSNGVVLIAGSNFTRVLPVTPGPGSSATPTSSASPTPSPSPSPTAVSAASEGNRCTY